MKTSELDLGELIQISKDSLYRAHKELESLGNSGIDEVKHDRVVDISTRGDVAVSEAVIKFLKEKEIPAILYTEEFGKVELTKNPRYVITFDDIDGTDNYHRGKDFLPYCSVISIFDTIEPKFEDVLVAGILEHNSSNLWLAIKDQGCYFNNEKISTSKREKLDRRTLVIIDHYMSAGEISRFLDIYTESWVKDFATSALHLAGVSSGLFDACITSSQKAHELGAGYLLIKEAGGFLSDFDGNSLDKVVYNFDAKYPVVAASTKALGETLLSKIKKNIGL